MTEVYCFSGSGHSMAVAKYIAAKLSCPIREISDEMQIDPAAETAVVVFPVYCQNLPQPVKSILPRLQAKYVALVATYGRISYGNVLYEAQGLVCGTVIAGAAVPIGHTFLNGGFDFCSEKLLPMLQRITAPRKAHIPKSPKNPLSDFAPGLRSRLGVKLVRTNACQECNICGQGCPMNAMRKGKASSACIRCLRCVYACPHKALHAQNRTVLSWYLNAFHKDEFKLYL